MQEFVFNDEHEFKQKVQDLIASGVSPKAIETYSPVPIHGIEEALKRPPTKVRVWASLGAISGTLAGIFLTNYTVWRYPLYLGEKQPFAEMPFVVIMFELTILLGSLATFIGFLALARLPNILHIIYPLDYGNQFAIVVKD